MKRRDVTSKLYMTSATIYRCIFQRKFDLISMKLHYSLSFHFRHGTELSPFRPPQARNAPIISAGETVPAFNYSIDQLTLRYNSCANTDEYWDTHEGVLKEASRALWRHSSPGKRIETHCPDVRLKTKLWHHKSCWIVWRSPNPAALSEVAWSLQRRRVLDYSRSRAFTHSISLWSDQPGVWREDHP